MIAMQVVDVALRDDQSARVLLVEDTQQVRLRFRTTYAGGEAILAALHQSPAIRPPTQVLLLDALKHFEINVHRATIDELRDVLLYAHLASLWTSTGRYGGFGPGETVALSLWYQRAFSRDELLRITETAWKKLGQPDAAQRELWLAELRRQWNDVAPGQNITKVVTPDGPTRFYDRRGRFAQVDDPAFGPAFLAIWLHPRSVVSDLRLELLGGRDAAAATAAN